MALLYLKMICVVQESIITCITHSILSIVNSCSPMLISDMKWRVGLWDPVALRVSDGGNIPVYQ